MGSDIPVAAGPAAVRRLSFLVAVLLGVELLDELYSGVPSVGSAEIHADFGTSYQTIAWALLLVPGLFSLLVEPALFVLADRYPRKWFVCGGLLAMAAAAFAAAAATSVPVLAGAVAVSWAASGCGVSLSQATLVDARPDARERVIARWALMGTAGDLAAPAMMAGLAALALGWRTGYVITGALALVFGLLLLRQRFPAPPGRHGDQDESDGEGGGEPGSSSSLGAALVAAVRNRRLLFWLGASALCDLLDEILVVFAALYLRDHLHAGPIERSLVLGACMVGGALGLVVTDRLLARVRPLRLLAASSAICAAVYLAWLAAPTVWLSALLMAAVGATAAPMYPIASAQAYAALPGRSGTVNAAGHVFTPLSLALPWLLGWIADHAGLTTAIGLLIVQPVGLMAFAAIALRRGAGRRSTQEQPGVDGS
jgi:FSR family fosmidomycin resistance protein-like MFS transporter